MRKEWKLVLLTTTISFTGSLPLGILNLSVAYLATRHNITAALTFAASALIIEVIGVRLVLLATDHIGSWQKYIRTLKWLGCLTLFILGITTLTAASHTNTHFQITLPFADPILSAVFLSVSNPFYIPFWIGWIVILKSKGMLSSETHTENYFVCAIGIGTAVAFTLYGLAGWYLIHLLGEYQGILNWLSGMVLLMIAVIQLYRMITTQENNPICR